MFEHLQLAEHQNFLASWNARAKGGGRGAIGLAAPHVAKALACVGDLCSRYFAGDSGLSVKAADLLPTYDGAGFQLETKATSAAGFRALLPDGIEPPKHTLMVLRHVVTTPREDRDKDILQTAGASVDPAMPLLWQHMIGLPIGRRIATVEHTPEVLRLATSLIDLNDLTADAAKLIEADALRFSHGFRVLEFRERKAESADGYAGFEVTKFEILECSLVSVPSNVDAVMEMYAKGGLSSEPMKRFAKGLVDERPAMVAGVTITKARREYGKPRLVKPEEKDADAGGKSSIVRKMFDVSTERLEPATLEIEWAARFLGCSVKDVSIVTTGVSGVMRGGFMKSLESMLAGMRVVDTRNMDHQGTERPPVHETISIKSDERRLFLTEGIRFLAGEGVKLVYRTFSSWHGQDYLFYSEGGEKAQEVVDAAWAELNRNNPLKGEAFALTGDFIERKGITWDDVFLDKPIEKSLRRTVKVINSKGAEAANRGVVLMGPPGTGKTLSGRVMLNEADATFIWVSAKDFWRSSAYYAFSGALALARSLAPAIVLYEDIDNWIDSYTVDLLKGEMDGLVQSSGVTTVLTTNFPDKLPAALIDRPGRFHDILEIHLPTRDVRLRMLQKWAAGGSVESLKKLADGLDGYSGAHIYELCHFAKVIRDEDECGIDEALTKAFDKVKEQRDLINQSQLSGSSYRPSRRDAGPVAAKSCGCGGLLVKSAPGPAEVKAGRVLSKRNLERLAEVRSDLQEIHDYDGMPRPCKAMCKTAMGVLDEVIREASPAEGEEEKSPATPAVHPHPQPALSPDQKFADAVLAANAAKLLQYRRAIDSAIEADALSHLSEELAELFGV